MKTYRGDVWLVDYGEPVGREQGYPRPALILHSPLYNLHRAGLAIAVPITSRKRGWPLHVEIPPGSSGLRSASWAMGEQIRAISTLRLQHRLGSVKTPVLEQMNDALRGVLEITTW